MKRLALSVLALSCLNSCAALSPSTAERCEGSLLERYDAAWYRWSVEGLPMRDCDAEALTDVRELARACEVSDE